MLTKAALILSMSATLPIACCHCPAYMPAQHLYGSYDRCGYQSSYSFYYL